MAEDPNSFAARSRAAYQNAHQHQTPTGNGPVATMNHNGNQIQYPPPPHHQRPMNPPQPQLPPPPPPSYRPRGAGGGANQSSMMAQQSTGGALPTATVSQRTKQDIEQKALSEVKHRLGLEAYAMKRSMDQPIGPGSAAGRGNMSPDSVLLSYTNGLDTSLSQTLDHCVSMLSELASSSDRISPKHYYEIHMFVSSQMQFMEEYIEGLPDEWNNSSSSTTEMNGSATASTESLVTPNDLYEIVQYCPKVLQRSYLMVAAGSALLKSTTSYTSPSGSVATFQSSTAAGAEATTTGSVGGGGTIAAICDAMMTNALVTEQQQQQEQGGVNQSSQSSPSSNMKWKNDITRMVLNELMETVKGVQCPLRGLFLRHYLLQSLKDKLPDTNTNKSSSRSYGNDISISYQFILKNFDEMNRLWIRIQHMPGANRTKSERKRREKERASLRLLVGSNLERLSQLDGITIELYQKKILPHILQTVCDCNDTLAQAYLMDCTIQVFSDHYHLTTLETLLSVLPLLNEKVNVRYLLQNIMDRLALPDEEDDDDGNNASNNEVGGEIKKLNKEEKRWNYFQSLGYDPFVLFDQCIFNVHEKKGSKIGLKEMIRLEVTLMEFALSMPTDPSLIQKDTTTAETAGGVQQQHIDHVNHCLTFVLKHFLYPHKKASEQQQQQQQQQQQLLDDPAVSEQLELLLTLPLDKLGLSAVLHLSSYAEVLSFLPHTHRKQVALGILENVTNQEKGEGTATVLRGDSSKLDCLYSILKPLIDEMPPDRSSMGGDEEDFHDKLDMHTYEQGILLGQLIHSWFDNNNNNDNKNGNDIGINNNNIKVDTDGLFRMCTEARKHLMKGPKENWSYTIPPLLYCVMKLIRQVHALEFPPLPIVVNTPEDEEHNSHTPSSAPPSAPPPPPPAASPPSPPASPPEETNNAVAASSEAGGKEKGESATTEANEQGDNATTSLEESAAQNKLEEQEQPSEQEPQPQQEDNKDANEVLFPTPPSSLPPSPPPPPPPQQPIFDKMINCRKLFVFLQKVISSLSQHYPELAIHLYLECALVADRCGILAEERRRSRLSHSADKGPDINETEKNGQTTTDSDVNSSATDDNALFQDMPLYNDEEGTTTGESNFRAMTLEFITLAYRCYDDDLMTTNVVNNDSSSQVRCLQQMVASLLRIQLIQPKEFLSFTTKTAQCAARLAKKSDQSRSVSLCSLLFDRTNPPFVMSDGTLANPTNNPQRVLECLQRSLKVADMCLKASNSKAGGVSGGSGNSVQLFVDALEYYVYYFIKETTPSITDKFVSSLIQLINEHMDSSKDYSDVAIQAQTHYRLILSYMDRHKKKEEKDQQQQ